MSEEELPSFVWVVAFVTIVNLMVPLIPTPDGLTSDGVHAMRAMVAGGALGISGAFWLRFKEHRRTGVGLGLGTITLASVATLASVRWEALTPTSVMAGLSIIVVPWIAAYVAGRSS